MYFSLGNADPPADRVAVLERLEILADRQIGDDPHAGRADELADLGPHFADAALLAGGEPALGIERAELQREGAGRIDRADLAAVPIVGDDLEFDRSRPA